MGLSSVVGCHYRPTRQLYLTSPTFGGIFGEFSQVSPYERTEGGGSTSRRPHRASLRPVQPRLRRGRDRAAGVGAGHGGAAEASLGGAAPLPGLRGPGHRRGRRTASRPRPRSVRLLLRVLLPDAHRRPLPPVRGPDAPAVPGLPLLHGLHGMPLRGVAPRSRGGLAMSRPAPFQGRPSHRAEVWGLFLRVRRKRCHLPVPADPPLLTCGNASQCRSGKQPDGQPVRHPGTQPDKQPVRQLLEQPPLRAPVWRPSSSLNRSCPASRAGKS